MIAFKNIYLKYGEQVVFDDFSLSIEKGSKVLLRAPSGKGKSTLIKLLLGFEKPEKGDILLNDRALNKSSIHGFRQSIGYVSQDVDLKNDIVHELINTVLSYKCNKHIPYDSEHILELFKQFELEQDILNKKVGLLSGGQRQRLGLVICILLNRDIWILDEIISGLDHDLKRKVVDFVMAQDKTIIIASHDDLWLEESVKVEVW